MNEVAQMGRGNAPARPEPRQAAAAALAGEDAILAVQKARYAASAAYREALNPPPGLPNLERAKWALEKLPSEGALVALHADVDRAVNAQPDDRKNRILVALMVDSIRRGRETDSGVAVEVLLHDLRERGYPPIVVADALRSLRHQATFAPSIAEVLAACSKSSEAMARMSSGLEMIAHARSEASAVLERAARMAATA